MRMAASKDAKETRNYVVKKDSRVKLMRVDAEKPPVAATLCL